MTIDSLKIASKRFHTRRVGSDIQLLDYNGASVPEVVLKVDEGGAMRISALLTREVGLGQSDAKRRRIERNGPAAVNQCLGCRRVLRTICNTFHNPAYEWDKPGGCRCKGVQVDD